MAFHVAWITAALNTSANAAPWARDLIEGLKVHDVKHIVTVPDSMLGPILGVAEDDPQLRLTSVHREEEAASDAIAKKMSNRLRLEKEIFKNRLRGWPRPIWIETRNA